MLKLSHFNFRLSSLSSHLSGILKNLKLSQELAFFKSLFISLVCFIKINFVNNKINFVNKIYLFIYFYYIIYVIIIYIMIPNNSDTVSCSFVFAFYWVCTKCVILTLIISKNIKILDL